MSEMISPELMEALENAYSDEAGTWDLPAFTLYTTSEPSCYDPSQCAVVINPDDDGEHVEFVWLHEAYHHYQCVCEGIDFDEAFEYLSRENSPSFVSYLYIPSERAANLFAYRVCKSKGWTIPSYFPKCYFPK